MTAQLTRRSLFAGAGALLVCSPAIVRASSLMPIKADVSIAWARRRSVPYVVMLSKEIGDQFIREVAIQYQIPERLLRGWSVHVARVAAEEMMRGTGGPGLLP